MASALSLGGGAAEGLDTFLNRLLTEERLKQMADAEAEQSRHNQATEGIQRDSLSAVRQNQIDLRIETARQHREQADARDDRNVTQQIALRPIDQPEGARSFATPEEKVKETSHGVPDSLYGDYEPPSMGKSTETKEVGPSKGGMPWAGTETQQIALRDKPTSNTVKTVTYKGKPVDANYDPKTQRYTLPGGQDITTEVGHYTEPKTPLFSPIQTGGGYANYDRRKGEVTEMTAPGGGSVPLADTADTRNRAVAMKRVQPMIDTIRELSPVINTKPGVQQIFAGGWRQVMAKANEDDDVAEYVSVIQAFTPLLARAEGHSGVLTEADFEHAMQILPTPRDSESLAKRKLARLEKILNGAAAATTSTDAPAAGGDAYQDYLNRSKKP